MIRKRAVYDPLEPTKEPRWYEVRDMHNRLLESRPLAPGSNLKRAFVVAMLEHIERMRRERNGQHHKCVI
jgi:hypothetical protein